MARPIVVLGAGGHGREVADVVDAVNRAADSDVWAVLGFVDDGAVDLAVLGRRGQVHLGGRDVLEGLSGHCFVVGVGSPSTRRALASAALGAGLEPVTLVHPMTSWGADTEVGAGSVICAMTTVTTNVRLGEHVHVNRGCHIGHDVRLGAFVTVNPGATVSGNVTVEDDVTIGTNAAVIQGLRIGAGATVGAGAAVVRDVDAGSTVVGVPAKPLPRR